MTTTTIEGKRAIVIDDHKLFTSGLCTILESIGLRIVSTFENGRDALYYLKNHEVDLIFSDINMPKMDGLQLCNRLHSEKINIKIIMLSMYEDTKIINEAFKCGANAYLSKNTEKEEIIEAIKKCLANKKYVNKQLLKSNEVLNENDAFIMKYKLTLRERDVLKLMLREERNQDISEELNISKRTVETHRKNILLKLEVRNNIGLAKIAVTYNLFN